MSHPHIRRSLPLVVSLALLASAGVAEEATAPTTTTPAATAPAATTPAEDVVTVEGHTEQTGRTASKTDTPPLLRPQSLGTIDEDLIKERHVIKLEDAVKNVAGVTIGGFYNDWDYFRIRGFDAGDSTRQDGLFTAPGYWITPDVYGFESIEVLKGPSSMLYGRSSIGGLVNMVSKRPTVGNSFSAALSGGTQDFAELGVDGNTSFADDQVGVRLVGLVRRRGTDVDGIDPSKRLYLAPSLTWWVGEHTTITLLSHYQVDDINTAWPLPASGTVTSNPNGDLPLDRNVGEPDFQNHVDNKRRALGYQLDHGFSERVTLRQNARVTRLRETFHGIYPDLLEADGRTLDRTVYYSDSDYLIAQIDTMLDVRLPLGRVQHDLLLGFDYMHERLNQWGASSTIDPLDIYNPVYGAQPSAPVAYSDARTTSRSVGLYAQDQISITDRLNITAGVRWDGNSSEDLERLTGDTTDSDAHAATWRVGAAYLFLPTTSVFSCFSTSFQPQPYNTTASGGTVDPETGNQIEGGVRTADRDGNYNATIAAFQITRRNVATADLTSPGASVVTGEQRSRGIEFDGLAKPAPGVSLTATYAFIKAVVTKDNSFPVGDRLLNVPDHSITAWAKYTIQEGPVRGLGAGLGGRWYSSQAGDLPNTFELPAYTVVDAGLFFDRGPLSAQINVYNLLNKEYAIGSYDSLYVLPGDPLAVRGTVEYTF